jgi:hypothetical protein
MINVYTYIINNVIITLSAGSVTLQ